MKLSKLGV